MNRRSSTRGLLGLGFASIFPLVLLGCPKKDSPPVVEAGPAPTPTPTQTEAVLAPLDDDGGADAADADAAKPRWTGPSLNTNQVRIKQCCNALRGQAKSLGTAPEAAQVAQAAAICDVASMNVGSTAAGQAPEFAPVRQMLAGKTLPPVCQGL